MKKTILLFLPLVVLIGCARDPDVLTKDDRAFIESKKGGSFKGDKSQRANLPQKMELALGALSEGRVYQAQQILALAQKLAESKQAVVADKCLRAALSDSTAETRTYELSFESCKFNSPAIEGIFSGSAELVLKMNGDQVASFQYEGVSGIRAFKKGQSDLDIDDSFKFSAKKSADGDSFHLTKGSAKTNLTSGSFDSKTQVELLMTYLDADLSAAEISNWHSNISGQGQNVNSTANPMIFGLSLDFAKDSATTAYHLQWGRDVRDGQLIFGDKDVTVISKAKNNAKEDKVSAPRQKATSIDSLLPWEFWF